jgi:5-methylcytosine-specific restriction endonuclease McrA
MRRNPNRQKAEDEGLKYYFSGVPCRSGGHLSERYTANGACVACSRAGRVEWRKENPDYWAKYSAEYGKTDKAKAAHKRWRENNPQNVKDIYAAWVTKNGDKRNAKRRQNYVPKPRKRGRDPDAPKRAGKRWREKNREFDKERAAKWRLENPELAKAVAKKWRSVPKNKEILLAKENRRRARKNRGGGSYTPADIKEIFFAQKGRCAFCRMRLGKDRHIDHIVPLSKGGTSNRQNLQLLCKPCNLSKGSKDQIEFMQAKGRLL